MTLTSIKLADVKVVLSFISQHKQFLKSIYPLLTHSQPLGMSHLIGPTCRSNNLKDLLMIDLLYTDWRLTGSENFHCPLVSENQTTT